jgi:L-methionine (R)-S-oxide reductase
VHSDPRYIACSFETSSEIVVPIRVAGAVVGEIDIDSHDLAAFSTKDREFLEACAAIVGSFIERTQAIPSSSK